jgi:hypothetical protein
MSQSPEGIGVRLPFLNVSVIFFGNLYRFAKQVRSELRKQHSNHK